jgi:signal transduction histidine kinase
MDDIQDAQQALIDLGLMTRVVCHELSNLLGNQLGYAQLLGRHGSATADQQRWLDEMIRSGGQLQSLIAQLQQRAHGEACTRGAPAATAAPAVKAALGNAIGLADAARTLGADVPLVALDRMLAILAGQTGTSIAELAPPARASAAWTEAMSGERAPGLEGVLIVIPDRSLGAFPQRWQRAASRILPPPEAASEDWECALVAGLLRQCRGELRHNQSPQGHAAEWIMCLPVRAQGVASPSKSS